MKRVFCVWVVEGNSMRLEKIYSTMEAADAYVEDHMGDANVTMIWWTVFWMED